MYIYMYLYIRIEYIDLLIFMEECPVIVLLEFVLVFCIHVYKKMVILS